MKAFDHYIHDLVTNPVAEPNNGNKAPGNTRNISKDVGTKDRCRNTAYSNTDSCGNIASRNTLLSKPLLGTLSLGTTGNAGKKLIMVRRN